MDSLEIIKQSNMPIQFSKYLTNVSQINNLTFNVDRLVIENSSYPIITSKFLESQFIFLNKSKIFLFGNKKNFVFLTKIIKKQILEHRLSYCNILELIGLSFTTTIKQNTLRLNLGYNHSIYYIIPNDITIHTKKKYIYIFSHSLQRLNFVINELINFRKLNAYKLKGIKLKDQLYLKKKKN